MATGSPVALAQGLPHEASGPQATKQGAAPERQEITIRPREVVHLRATLGAHNPGSAMDCVQISTHSGFTNYQNPVGQMVTVQAGFAQGEYTAQTYALSPSDFPIKINLIETIFATASSVVPTTTQWTVSVWQGTPQTGTLVATYSSDDVVIPHLVLPAGDAAGIIQFGIDPTHPEQLIIQNDGSNTFSVGFRIDQHNSQTGNPCTQGPPTCCNAFPTTDPAPPHGSGLSSPMGNWLFGINCGLLGCPPNGGWSRFSNLSVLCRPTGDWILRAQWQPLSCTPGIGACCLPTGSCQITSPVNCTSQSGLYRGDGTTCATANCPDPTGACCFSNGNCLNLTEPNCGTAGGTWLGGGTACSGNSCPTGACCLPSGQCAGAVTTVQCTAQGGVFQGVGSQCGTTSCPQPSGACCLQNGGCLMLSQGDCGQIPSSFWAGAGVQCGPAPHAACCYANCDGSTVQPILNIDDFTCFIASFAAATALPHAQQVSHYANCDSSTVAPVLNIDDFTCFIGRFAAGCP